MSSKISPEQFYDGFAPTYDKTLKSSQVNAQHVHEAAKIFHRYHKHQNGSILDIGCGTGLLKDLLEGDFTFTGIDISKNMLRYAAQRGYTTIHQPVEVAIAQIADRSYDFVFALSSLLFVRDIETILTHLNRIARRAILLSLDNLTEDYILKLTVEVYNHSQVSVPNAKEDYFIQGWTSPTTGIPIETRMIYLETGDGESSPV